MSWSNNTGNANGIQCDSGILALSTNDIKVGTTIEVDGAPWRVMGMQFFFHLGMFLFIGDFSSVSKIQYYIWNYLTQSFLYLLLDITV